MAKSRVTSSDVAARAGVSQSAVSRTYTAGASVAAKTREKVLAAARELGYRPNAIARSLITNRSRMIGVVMAYLENQFYPDVLEALGAALQSRGYQLLLFTGFKDRNSDPVFETILQYRVDGLILASTTLSSALSDECASAGIPIVLFNRTTERGAVSSVTTNNFDGGRQVAEFLVAGEHKRFGYIAGVENSSTNFDRERGFFTALAAHGITDVAREEGFYSMEGAAIAARRMLSRKDRPDAIFVANDHMAISVIDVAKYEFGLRIPEDLSIVGYDDVGPARWPGYAITSFSQPLRPMVDSTIDILMRQLTAGEMNAHHDVIEGSLIVRRSARVPASYADKVQDTTAGSRSEQPLNR